MTFTKHLLHWYQENGRELPWRGIDNPYYIWLSEIILQQTRVAQGTSYFEDFITSFPTLNDLASASEDQVLKCWQGLGYYSRARNLHATAQYIVQELQGVFPQTYLDLLQLKGVGPYTAAAIASFAFQEDVGVVDGNVFRVLARYFGIFEDTAAPKTRNVFQSLVNSLVPQNNSSDFNHAIMDFGAIQCVPKNPDCIGCLLHDSCYAFREKKVHLLPVKNKKTSIKKRYLYYFVVRYMGDNVLVQQRKSKDIWQGLYEFPLIESSFPLKEADVYLQGHKMFPEIKQEEVVVDSPVIHKLSHQHLYIHWIEIELSSLHNQMISIEEAKELPFPIVLWHYIEANFL